ncbi:hypothetical protein BC834DRAFT_621725 [Gloeopeniophorella convolvens]|nr:hypothetical protein BC834DRAFT_621725 [Gloeopeniophorella convolvens]
MATVINVSDKFGKFLLDGWSISDRTCPAEGCSAVPLLRSPGSHASLTWFCPHCEGDGTLYGPSQPAADQRQLSSPSLDSSTHYSRSSTPPTEDSNALSSPTFAPPVETEESIRRRQQSDFASAEIGKRLLRGWAMLADECPSNTCFGVPLVRPPKTGGDKDPRMECVVCGTVYVTERDSHGFGALVPVTAPASSKDGTASSGALTEISNATLKGKQKALDAPVALEANRSDVPTAGASSVSNPPTVSSRLLPQPHSTPENLALATSTQALEVTLSALSQRLLLLSGQSILDPIAIAQTAEAITKIGQALATINALQRS